MAAEEYDSDEANHVGGKKALPASKQNIHTQMKPPEAHSLGLSSEKKLNLSFLAFVSEYSSIALQI